MVLVLPKQECPSKVRWTLAPPDRRGRGHRDVAQRDHRSNRLAHRHEIRTQVERQEARVLSRRPGYSLVGQKVLRAQSSGRRDRVLTRVNCLAEGGQPANVSVTHLDLRIRTCHLKEDRRATGNANVMEAGAEAR